MNKSLTFSFFASLILLTTFLSLKAEELSPIDLSQYDQSSNNSSSSPSYQPSTSSSYGQSTQRSYPSDTPSWGSQQAVPTIRINPDSNENQTTSRGVVEQTEEPSMPPLPKSTRVNAYPSTEEEGRPAAQAHYRSSQEADEQNLISRTSYDQPSRRSSEPSPEEANPETKSKKLAFMLRELSEIRQAALSAGGDIKVSITTVGIDAEDLIVPLKKQGIFDVELRDDSDRVIVKSRDNSRFMPLEKDIADLKMERRRLLNDIADLQNMKNNNQSVPTHESSASYQNMSYNKVAISDEVATVTLAPRLK